PRGSPAAPTPYGSFVHTPATEGIIGGTALGAGNTISGNGGLGIVVENVTTAGFRIQGNYIGTDPGGSAALGRQNAGVWVEDSTGVVIGGTAAGAGNVISGHAYDGVVLIQGRGNLVAGNKIGTNAAGTAAVPNGESGVLLRNTNDATIGGTAVNAGNVIAYNGKGVVIGESVNDNGVDNRVLGNSIYANTQLGIDLANNGVTPNDPLDPDPGPNLLQNYPVLTSAVVSGTTLTVKGTLNSIPNRTYRVEFFASDVGHPSGFGEGKTYLGFQDVQVD